ncbi:PEP-CTERM sorting domain-containing protein [Ideonella sp. BN130291]|uniref:PEP-CTERM sorting domain-containing protein n=1 Tax=Ideonella sp. BN130291 TaxID=3112940 RepID=UPI002E267D6A|nr:PEP-CTERM sorting domain-containing protein [Ideonella sp. BN130291]
MNHQLGAIALGALLLSQAATAATTRIGADAFADTATVVTFETGSTALPGVDGMAYLETGPSSTERWFGASGNFSGFFGEQGMSNLVSATYSDMGVSFANPVYAVGSWLGNIPDFTHSTVRLITIEAYGTAGDSLGRFRVLLPRAEGEAVFFGIGSTDPIARIEWRDHNRGFFGMDNLTFQTSPVPEPTTSSLVAAGLAALGLAVRRRRSRAA